MSKTCENNVGATREIPWERSDTVGAAAAVCRRAMETRTSDKNPFMIAGCHAGEVIVGVSLGCTSIREMLLLYYCKQ
ncbi:hypothetical protein BDR03DRAFT_969885 [Suillus americanus]|nr:hypothetical protein BDR03DRAFT_969885 [Suillus americanus]